MLKDGDPIVIRRVANGFVVEPLALAGEGFLLSDMIVFNDLGFVAGNRDDSTVPYLLGFIAAHFTTQGQEGGRE
jgi:hypothetical protein